MNPRALLALLIALVGGGGLLTLVDSGPPSVLALASATSRDANRTVDAAGSGHARAETKRYLAAIRAEERRGYVKRGARDAVSMRGWLSVTHFDGGPKDTTPSEPLLILHTGKHRTFRLNVTATTDIASAVPGTPATRSALRDGAVLTLTGTLQGGAVAVAAATATAYVPFEGLGVVESEGQRPARAVRQLTMLVNFPEDRDGTPGKAEPVSRASVVRGTFNQDLGERTVSNYFKQVSRGNVTLVGDVTEWIQLSIPRVDCHNGDAWFAAAESAVRNAGTYNPDDYDTLSIVTANYGCDRLGFASGHRYNVVLANINSNSFDSYIATHEFGHNLGLSHAGAHGCRARSIRVSMSSDCTNPDQSATDDQVQAEYDDANDVMGGSWNMHELNGFHRASLGFLPLANIETVTADGLPHTIIGNHEPLGSSKQLLTLDRSTAAANPRYRKNYYLEYRQAAPTFDPYLPGDATIEGVSIGLGATLAVGGPTNDSVTQAINASPGRQWRGNPRTQLPGHDGFSADADFALHVGQSYWDPLENITFTTLSVGATSASVKISPGGPVGAPTVVAVVGNRVIANGGAGARNVVGLGIDEDRIIVSDMGNPVTAGAGCVKLDAITVGCSKRGVEAVTVDLGDGDDTATVFETMSLATTLIGGAGNDAIDGGSGDDRVESGSALDGSDVVTLGGGANTVSYAQRSAPLVLRDVGSSLGQAGEQDWLLSPVAKIIGGTGNDLVSAIEPIDHTVDPGPGTDTVTTGSGADTILARDGAADGALDCGSGTDRVLRDLTDPAGAGCETSQTAAQATITAGPGEGTPTAGNRPTFSFNAPASTGVTFQCKIEAGAAPGAGAFAACSSPFTPATALSDGVKTFSVRAVVGGAASGTTVLRTFTLDTAAPETAFASAPGPITNATAVFALAAPEIGAFLECSLDAEPFVGCNATKTLTGLTAGVHTFRAQAVDRAGNADLTPVTFTWTVDLTPPHTIFDGSPADGATIDNPQPTFTFHADEPGSTFRCQWDAAGWAPCTSPVTRVDQGLGQWTLRVEATDLRGNVETPPALRTFTVVAQPFDTVITGGPPADAYTNDPQPKISFDVTPTNPTTTFECAASTARINAASAFAPCISPFAVPTAGWRVYVAVRAVTAQGARDYLPALRTVYLDYAAPDTQIDTGPAADAILNTATASFGFSAPGEDSPEDCAIGTPHDCTTYECALDAAPWATCPTPMTTAAMTNGAHTIAVRARDQAGNVDPSPASRSFTVALPQVLAITGLTPTTQGVKSLTTDPTLGASIDWVHWKSAITTQLDRRAGAARIGTWAKYGAGAGTPIALSGATTYSWTNALGSPIGSSAIGVGIGAGNNRGFTIPVPAVNTELRTLRIFAAVRGATTRGTLQASFNGQPPVVGSINGTSDVTPFGVTFAIAYRPTAPTDKLTISWFQSSGPATSASQVVLYAAALT